MEMRIEFEDQGQDLLRMDVDGETGLIINCGPYHADLYADGQHYVELESVWPERRVFYYDSKDHAKQKMGKFFRWNVEKVTLNSPQQGAAK